MGCGDSKSTGTENQQQSQGAGDNSENQAPTQQQKSEEEVYVTEKQAITYVTKELGVSKEQATKLVKSINKNSDGKIANKELIALRDEVNKRKDAVRPKFEAYDKDGSGTVTTEEAHAVMQDIFHGIPESHVKAMVKRFDKNDTGKMNFNEFVGFYAHVCVKREALLKRFDELDTDNSGTLVHDEIVDVIAEECAIDTMFAWSLVDDFDQNKDGQLSKKEFAALFVKLFS